MLTLLGGCGGMSDSASYRFRMTVEVATPQGVRTGSSVYEVASAEGARIGDRSGGGTGLGGEAIVIDLPDGPVFALLNSGSGSGTIAGMATEAFAVAEGRPVKSFDDFLATVARLGSRWSTLRTDLPRRRELAVSSRSDGVDDSNWPLMVRFRDIADPKSVERVDPEAIGVRRIVLETTRDAVTTGIEKRIPWIIAAEDFQYKGIAYGDIYPMPSSDFRSGVK